MDLGELAAHGHIAPGEYSGDGRERIRHPSRALVEDEHRIQQRQPLERAPALPRLAREETAEVETGTAEAAGHIRRGNRRRPGKHDHGHPRPTSCRDQPLPRVRNARHAGIAAERDRLARLHAIYQLGHLRLQARFVAALEMGGDPEGAEQFARDARVLRVDDIRLAQGVEGPRRHIAQVAQRRRAYVEHSGHMRLLVSCATPSPSPRVRPSGSPSPPLSSA